MPNERPYQHLEDEGPAFPRAQAGDDHASNEAPAYSTVQARWGVLALFSFGSLMNQCVWISFAPIRAETQAAYGVDGWAVDTLSLCYMILYPVVTLPASYTLGRRGLRGGVVVGSLLTALGCVLRAASVLVAAAPAFSEASGPPPEGAPPHWRQAKFLVLLAGQALAAAGQPFFTNAPPLLAATWFAADERAIADAMATLSATVGAAVGMVVPALAPSIPSLLVAELVVAGVAFILILRLLPGQPSRAPSPSAAVPRTNFCRGIAEVWTKPGFLPTLVAFGVGLGSFNALATLVEPLVAAFGFSADDASAFGAGVVVFGILGAGWTSSMADRRRNYARLLLVCYGVSLGAMLSLPSALESAHFTRVFAVLGLLGAAMMSVLPLSYELCAEVVFPLSEAIPTGLLMTAGQVVGVCIILAGESALAEGAARELLYTVVICMSLGLVATLMFDAPLLRTAAEAAHTSAARHAESEGPAHVEGKPRYNNGSTNGPKEDAPATVWFDAIPEPLPGPP